MAHIIHFKKISLYCLPYSGMNEILYYGITLSSTNMAGNVFLNYFLLSLIDLPSAYLGSILVEKSGRRWTQAGFFLFCTMSAFSAVIGNFYPDCSLLVLVGALGLKYEKGDCLINLLSLTQIFVIGWVNFIMQL